MCPALTVTLTSVLLPALSVAVILCVPADNIYSPSTVSSVFVSSPMVSVTLSRCSSVTVNFTSPQ